MIPSLKGGTITSGTIGNLYVKQQLLSGLGFLGATVTVWVNPKTGGIPVQTPITCTTVPFPPGDIYGCNDTVHTYAALPGDRVIVIVTPLSHETVAPITATLDYVYQPNGL
jgi:hypothetical protein